MRFGCRPSFFLISSLAILSFQLWSGVCVGQSPEHEFRIWTTVAGRRSDVKLAVVKRDASTVTLKREDTGKTVTLRIDQLSQGDQAYLLRSRIQRTTPPPQSDSSAPPSASDWRQFRGPRFNTTTERGLPIRWSATENIAWKADLPGPGASSPIVVGNRIYITCYSRYAITKQNPGDSGSLVRHLVCVSRNEGRGLWKKDVPAVRSPAAVNSAIEKHGYASHSPTSDGQRVFVHFGNSGVLAFDLEGKQLWKADIGEGVSNYGSGASLVVHDNRLLVNASIESKSLIALDPATGREMWKTPLKHSYTTPIILEDGRGRNVACLTDYDRGLVGFDLATGREVWRWTGFYEPGYGCSSPVYFDGVIYGTASSEGPVGAFRPQGNGDITESAKVWTDDTRYRPRVTSPIIHDGKLFWIENSIGVIYDAKTGERLSSERLPWKGCYATPLLAEGRLYVTTNYDGTFVISADTQLKQIAHNVIDDEGDDERMQINASPVPHRGQLLLRTNMALYCIGRK